MNKRVCSLIPFVPSVSGGEKEADAYHINYVSFGTDEPSIGLRPGLGMPLSTRTVGAWGVGTERTKRGREE